MSKILSAPIEHGSFHNYRNISLYGSGGFFDNLKSIVGKVTRFIEPIARAVSGVSGIAGQVASAALPVISGIRQAVGGRFVSARKLSRRLETQTIKM